MDILVGGEGTPWPYRSSSPLSHTLLVFSVDLCIYPAIDASETYTEFPTVNVIRWLFMGSLALPLFFSPTSSPTLSKHQEFKHARLTSALYASGAAKLLLVALLCPFYGYRCPSITVYPGPSPLSCRRVISPAGPWRHERRPR